MSDTTAFGSRVSSLTVGKEQNAYSKVILHVGQKDDGTELVYVAGNDTGLTMEADMPWGSQALANAMLARLKRAGQYQPFNASSALLDPAAEMGDGVTASDIYSAIYKRTTTFSPLMASDVEAPCDEEVDHEFPYESRQDREYKRETAYTRSQLKINADSISAEVSRSTAAEGALSSRITMNANSITSEVTRATNAEGNLSTRITQNATSITSEVTRATKAEGNLSTRITQNATDITARVTKSGGSNSSFAWSLQNDNFSLIAGNKTVFKCTKSGIEIDGKITARTGYIGNGSSGFTITDKAIYNGVTSMTDAAHAGVYLGTNGIRLGKGVFSVDSNGKVTASNLNITGGSIVIKDGSGAEAFKVTSTGAVTAKNLTLNGGSINLGNGVFKVTSAGAVTASNLTINGGAIKIGSNFNVTKEGNVTANNMRLTGTLTVGGSTITADRLRQGAQYSYDGHSNWDEAHKSTSSGGYCYTGASNGNSAQRTWNTAQTRNGGLSYIEANDVCARRALWLGDTQYGMGSIRVPTGGYISIGTRTYYVTFTDYENNACLRPQ